MSILNLRYIGKLRQFNISEFSLFNVKYSVLTGPKFLDISKRQNSNWTFRSEFEKNPVPDPIKLRNRYSNFYFDDLELLKNKMNQVYLVIVLGGMLLVLTGVPHKIIAKVEKYFGSKENDKYEKIFDEQMSDEPDRVRKYFTKASATSVTLLDNEEPESEDNDVCEDKPKKGRVGFRDSRIIAYEDRIRSYSTPDKIFRYFATVQDYHNEVYMTPQDFVRSITPGVKQPEGLGLDSFRRIDIRKERIETEVSPDSVFYLFGDNALINFSDYVFLLTVISTPQRQFEIAFRMFDLNGDGELDVEEFDVVRSIIRSGSAMGKRHRDNSVTGNTLNNLINSSLSKYFFGKSGNRKLTIEDFAKFQSRLQKEIMNLEFNRYRPENGKIKESDFADSILMYAEFSENKKKKFLRRVRQHYRDENAKGISFEDFFAFSHLLRCISDVDTALTFYHLAGAAIDRQTLKHVSKAVANVELSDHIIDIVFILFDENNDGHLSNKEFVFVMKQRLLRGLDRPMDTGFVRLVSAMSKCAKEAIISEI